MKKTCAIILAVLISLFSVQAFAAGGLTSGDQAIYGNKTFENNVIVKKNLTVLGALLGINQYSKIFYVDSGSGHDSAGNYGTDWEHPFATLEYAINQCTAGRGDIIFVLPGHNEGITTAAEIDFDIQGISVIGLGVGELMPTIDFDNANGSVAVGADDVTIENIRFRTSANAVTAGLDIEAGVDDTHVIGCHFGYAETATDEFAISLRIGDGSTGTVIKHCEFHAGAQAAVVAIKLNSATSASDHILLKDNWITGNYSTAPIQGVTTASTNLLIDGNVFFTGGSADTFNLVAASTGIVGNNIITMNAASAALALDIGNCLNFENYLIADDDVGGAKAAVVSTTFTSVAATADD